jgi:hypothetical protein
MGRAPQMVGDMSGDSGLDFMPASLYIGAA